MAEKGIEYLSATPHSDVDQFLEDGERAGGGSGGGTIWLWIGAGILISQLVRFFTSMGGG